MDTMSIDLHNEDVIFRANGSKIKFPGFMKVYVEGSDDSVEEKENALPDVKKEINSFQKISSRSSISHSLRPDILKPVLSKP